MDSCQEPHARWLEHALLDERESIPAEDLAALEACSVCAAEIAALEDMQGQLALQTARLRSEEAEDLARLLGEKRPEDRDIVRAIHAQHIATEERPKGRTQQGPWRLFLALAAAALVATVIPRRDAQPDPGPATGETMLGGISQGAIMVTQSVYDADGLQLAWEPLAARSYRVVVMDSQLDELDAFPVTSPELHVDADRSSPWPNELNIEIIPLSAAQRPIAPSTTLPLQRAR